MNYFICCFGAYILFMLTELFIINFVYFSNIALFEDLILTKKNKKKLRKYYMEVLSNDK